MEEPQLGDHSRVSRGFVSGIVFDPDPSKSPRFRRWLMLALTVSPPTSTEYAPYYERYLSLVAEKNVLPALEEQLDEALAVLHAIPETQGNVRHPPYTWSIKEVVGHLIDCERIMAYRALRFARNDPTALPAFEENDYVRFGDFDQCRLADLITEFEFTRRSHLAMFRNWSEAAWQRRGVANNTEVSVRALAYIILGHTRHHLNIIKKRMAGKTSA